jgi:NAD(P)-dependent dehydrogenase (short-subunit alcohol dehydrogenase family)
VKRPDLHSLQDRHVVVTGAASGIGRAVAMALSQEGALLYLTDRHQALLDDVVHDLAQHGGRVEYVGTADVSDFAQVQALAAAVHQQRQALDVVMNVAGVSTWGTVEALEHRHWQTMVDINLMGPIHVIETFVPPMIAARRGGHVVNVSSAAGLIGLPWHAAYSAAKFGLRGVSEVLRFDLRQHGIGVSLVCPGGVATPLTNTVEVVGVDKSSPEFEKLRERFTRRAVSPEKAAQAILNGVKRNRYLVFTSNDIRAIHLAQRCAPKVYELVMRELNRRASVLVSSETVPS